MIYNVSYIIFIVSNRFKFSYYTITIIIYIINDMLQFKKQQKKEKCGDNARINLISQIMLLDLLDLLVLTSTSVYNVKLLLWVFTTKPYYNNANTHGSTEN